MIIIEINISLNDFDDDVKMELLHFQELLEMKKQEKYLKMHTYDIYQDKDNKWNTYIIINNKRKHIKRKEKKDLIKYIVDYYKSIEECPTLEKLFNTWNSRRLEIKQISRSSYDRYNQCYDRHFQKFGKTKITDLTIRDVRVFLEDENSRCDLGIKAYNLLKSIVKGILYQAEYDGHISLEEERLYDYAIDKVNLKHNNKKKLDSDDVFTEEETTKLIQYCKNNIDILNLGILLMCASGLRVGELVALQPEDLTHQSIFVNKTETRYRSNEKNENGKYIWNYVIKETPKCDKNRTVILPGYAEWIVDQLLLMCEDGREYIFIKNNKRVNTSIIDRRLDTICKKCGFKRKSPHKIRKTYLTILMDNKVDNSFIKSQSGHSDIATSEKHYHKDRKNEAKKRNILSSIGEFSLLQNNVS